MTVYELITQPVPKQLFHYTSMDGLRGILSSHSMFATDSLYLNDTTEIANSLPTVRDVLSSSAKSLSPKLVQTMLGLLEDEHSTGFLSSSKSQYFILSFSTEGDDLQQWRGYGDDTHGACIGFDLQGLRPPPYFDTMVTFAKCMYDHTEKLKLVVNLASSFCQRDADLSAIADDPKALGMEWALWQMDNPRLLRHHFMDEYKRKLRAKSNIHSHPSESI